MKRKSSAIIAMVVIASLCISLPARYAAGQTDDPATPVAVSTGAAYMHIANAGTSADRLIAGSTMVAATVEIHEVVDAGGVMKMQPVDGGLEIPAGGSVDLKPGGYHVMLIGLTASLTTGTTYELTLTFAQAGDVKLTVPVYESETEAMAATPAAGVTVGPLTISGFWSRSAPAMDQDAMSGATAAGFMTIANSGSEPDRLIAARTDIAMATEIHEMKEGKGGVMEMSPLADGLEIPAGGSVSLEPGGYHIMLIGIKEDLSPGMTYELTLTFEKAGDVTLTVPVQSTATNVTTPPASVTVGSITVSGQWTRSAPAMNGNGNHEMNGQGTPASGM